MAGEVSKIISELKNLGSPERAKHSLRFFRTGKGEYGEGDVFYGATVPEMRSIVKKYNGIDFKDIQKLMENRYHECRMIAILILVDRYEHAKKKNNTIEMKKIYETYLGNAKYINNWDLVDVSAPKIVGSYIYDNAKDRTILYRLAKSKDLWERRISIVSTFYFIYRNDFDDTIKISEILVNDKHDLIHKATGWMLREVGKRDQETEEKFLKKHYRTMPRTMLRYAIERFDDKKKKFYMKG